MIIFADAAISFADAVAIFRLRYAMPPIVRCFTLMLILQSRDSSSFSFAFIISVHARAPPSYFSFHMRRLRYR